MADGFENPVTDAAAAKDSDPGLVPLHPNPCIAGSTAFHEPSAATGQ